MQAHFDSSELLRDEQKPQGKLQEPHTLRTAAPCIKNNQKAFKPIPRNACHCRTSSAITFQNELFVSLLADDFGNPNGVGVSFGIHRQLKN